MTKLYARAVLAGILAVLTAIGPVSPAFAQDPPAPQPGTQDPDQTKNQVAVPPPAAPQPQAPAIPVALGSSKHNYSYGPRVFPTFLAPYRPIPIEHPELSNAPRLDQLIHSGKLEITLQDAVELALENSLDIVIQRYTPWLADTDILLAKSGGSPRGFLSVAQVPGSVAADVVASSANLPFQNLDPTLTSGISIFSGNTPLNNPFTTGAGTTGSSTLLAERVHSSQFNFGYSQGFTSGTTFSVAWDNNRGSSSPTANLLNPSVTSSLTATISQQLLNGCCFDVNRRNIIIAKNNRKIADLVFMQQAITTVTNTITAYWELVYARENVKVEQQAVAVSQKLYNDNKKQLEIGTMAPLDVTRAESELASDQGNLLVAQTTQLQDEQVLKNAISKNPLAPNLINVEIIPTDLPARPETIEAASFEDAIKEAFTKRPDVLQEGYNLKNADIDVRATANALLPVLTLSGQYISDGLAGNQTLFGPSVTEISKSTIPIVDANGNPVSIYLPSAPTVPIPIFQPTVTTTAPITGVSHGGFGNAQSQIFHNEFPSYVASLNLTLPLRNRAAQSENARAILTARQIEAQTLQIKNAALLDVRNTFIALEQDRARVDAAVKARQLQQETFDAEQKKYALGASTVYLVIQTQRDLVTAQGTELRALADLVEAKANYERALGRTLETNRVTIAGGQQFEHDTLIPGTRDGQVIGTDKIFSNAGAGSGQK
ncbi:MAG TPA: TolC family protein [Candidatus Acidoferrum sp.]|nr:TolC family protein [Candidatus Acidoferrum sp.]